MTFWSRTSMGYFAVEKQNQYHKATPVVHWSFLEKYLQLVVKTRFVKLFFAKFTQQNPPSVPRKRQLLSLL